MNIKHKLFKSILPEEIVYYRAIKCFDKAEVFCQNKPQENNKFIYGHLVSFDEDKMVCVIREVDDISVSGILCKLNTLEKSN